MLKEVREHRTVALRLQRIFKNLEELTNRFRDLVPDGDLDKLDNMHDDVQEMLKSRGYSGRFMDE